MLQGLIQWLKASVDFSWMLAPALHKRQEIDCLEPGTSSPSELS